MKILIVEDEPTLREGLIDLIRGEGHEVEAVGDGEAAIDRGKQGGFDLVLLDLMLPKVDGLEVLRRVKSDESTRRTPVVILTTSSADKDIAQSYEYHANSYVVKPMDFSKFESLMDDLGYYWLAWNQNPLR